MHQKFAVLVLLLVSVTLQLQAQTSPYYGWFKGKTEFSFISKSITSGKVAGMQTESTVTSTYFVKNGLEGVKEISEMKLNGKAQPAGEKIYITSAEANYVINPKTKMYYTEKGDYGAFAWSKVWQWTRKRSDSYDNISKNKAVSDDGKTECYSISGISFFYNKNKQLQKYEGDAGGMHTVMEFGEYKDSDISDELTKLVNSIKAGEYTKTDDMFSL